MSRPQNYIIVEDEEDEQEKRGCSGCVWGIGGAAGCMGLMVIIILVLLLLGATTVDSIIGGVRSIFNPEVDTQITTVVLERIQNISSLRTTTYNFTGIVTSERDMPGILAALYGDRLVMMAVGRVEAGINVDEINAGSITVDGNRLTVRIPYPVIINCFLDEDASYVISRDTGLFASPLPNLDQEARRFAIRQFRNTAVEDGILDSARTQAEGAIREIILLGLPSVSEVSVETLPQQGEIIFPPGCGDG